MAISSPPGDAILLFPPPSSSRWQIVVAGDKEGGAGEEGERRLFFSVPFPCRQRRRQYFSVCGEINTACPAPCSLPRSSTPFQTSSETVSFLFLWENNCSEDTPHAHHAQSGRRQNSSGVKKSAEVFYCLLPSTRSVLKMASFFPSLYM